MVVKQRPFSRVRFEGVLGAGSADASRPSLQDLPAAYLADGDAFDHSLMALEINDDGLKPGFSGRICTVWPSFFARRRATLQQIRKGLSMIEFELVSFNRTSLLGKAVEV